MVPVPALKNIATRLRIESIQSTTKAGSGHPSSCCSAADIVSVLFFHEMRFDPNDPHRANNDRFILSKGTPRRSCMPRGLKPALCPARRCWAPAVRLRSRRSSHAAIAVGGRGHGSLGPGHLRRRGHRAQCEAHRLGLSHLRAPGRRRVRRRIRAGSRDAANFTSSAGCAPSWT